jgi:hypothetical protein
LKYFFAVSGGLLAALPLELRLRGKSTAQSHRAPIYYVDLTIKAGISMTEAIASARAESKVRHASGFDQGALDEAARQGFASGAFEESEEEGAAVVEEFFQENFDAAGVDGGFADGDRAGGVGQSVPPPNGIKPGLADKLNQKAVRINGHGAAASIHQPSYQVPHGQA